MKLSMAMMLGSTTCKMRGGNINFCAIGAALNAVGVPQNRDRQDFTRLEATRTLWPWLFGQVGMDYLQKVVCLFDGKVVYGEMTYEQLVDYVVSVEPACETCNRFECSCVQVAKHALETAAAEVVAS